MLVLRFMSNRLSMAARSPSNTLTTGTFSLMASSFMSLSSFLSASVYTTMAGSPLKVAAFAKSSCTSSSDCKWAFTEVRSLSVLPNCANAALVSNEATAPEQSEATMKGLVLTSSPQGATIKALPFAIALADAILSPDAKLTAGVFTVVATGTLSEGDPSSLAGAEELGFAAVALRKTLTLRRPAALRTPMAVTTTQHPIAAELLSKGPP
mmetsp:Transcript_83934/g.271207  ORF Transcript_83934/g.271207 Transcript_83934/m.271207 type:complete len:210 (-) Transcript_83934:216-845(-)